MSKIQSGKPSLTPRPSLDEMKLMATVKHRTDMVALAKTCVWAGVILALGWMFRDVIKFVVQEPVDKINALAKFVMDYGLGVKTMFVGIATLLVATGLVAWRNNKLVHRIDKMRTMLQVHDPEKTSSGLNQKGRVKK